MLQARISALLLLAVGSVWAQTSQVTGVVLDPTNAVVAGATVTALNAATGLRRETKSNASGVYAIPSLQPGSYDLNVARDGFKPVSQTGLHLEVDQVARVDFHLEIGNTTETVNVTGAAALMQTETASLGQEIDNKRVVTLPLNGRDYTQLVTLSPGASPNRYSRASNGFSLNGGTTLQTTLLLDGTDNKNYEIGLDTGDINALSPSIDALQEFKIETANYSAEYGRSANGIISATIKSGTNGFHGDLFEFLRNDALDANDFFANAGGLRRQPLRRNQFGATLGGPIVRNHSFFFVSYQGTRLSQNTSGLTTVPTGNAAAGSLGSTNIYDPLNVVNGLRQRFANNTIPANRLDPLGLKVASLYPAANLPGASNNYAYSQAGSTTTDEIDSRFDQQISTKDTLFARFSRGWGQIEQGGVFAAPGNGGNGSINATGGFPWQKPLLAWSVAAGETHLFTPSLVNDFHAGFADNSSNQLTLAAQPMFAQFGFQGIPQLPGINGLPDITVTGFSALGDRTFSPNLKHVRLAQLRDTLSWNHGKHDIHFGGEAMRMYNFADSANLPRGTFNFNGQFTSQTPGKGSGSALADLLLGQSASAGLGTIQVMHLRSISYGFFVNDSWKATPWLTLNVGVRYDIQTPYWERDNRQSNAIVDPSSPQFGTLVPAQNGSILNRSFSNLDTNNIAPRIGLAWKLNDKTVIRSGFGIFYGNFGYIGNNDSGTANPPYLVNVTVPTATTSAVSSVPLSAGFPAGFVDPARVANPSLFGIAKDFPMPAVDQWNLSLQRQIAKSSTLTTSYVGSSSSYVSGLIDINQPIPGPGAVNPRRPLPAIGQIEYQSPYGHASYHALQVSFDRRLSQGLSVTTSYTWSHSIDNVHSHEDSVGGAFPQNPRDWGAERSSSGFDLRQRLVASAIYEIPVGRAGGMLGANKALRTILGGWQAGGIFVAQSGSPVSPSITPNPANTTGTARPDAVCNSNLPSGERSIYRWFNTSCFQPAVAYRYGNAGRNTILSPGLINVDFLGARSFHFTETRYVEFRAEFFNLTNTAHFGSPNANIGTAQAGTITSTSSPSREIQFGLKVWF